MYTRTVLTSISVVYLTLMGTSCDFQRYLDPIHHGPGGHHGGGGGGGGAPGTCSRMQLQGAVDAYLAAVRSADTSKMSLAPDATYIENFQAATLGDGIWQTPLPVAFHRSSLDVVTCQSFTEVIVTEGGHPYVIGTRLKVDGCKISEIESIVTDDGDWQFDANTYLTHSSAEDWSVLPSCQRPTRDELLAAANAYYDVFMDNTIVVPWGDPCARLEGGKIYTDPTCNVDVPSGVEWAERHFVVDADTGTIDGFALMFGTGGLPDSHLFRMTNGTIRYVHTLTICPTYNCGM
jgi:hypothetical protein